MTNQKYITPLCLFTLLFVLSSCGSRLPRKDLQNLPTLIEIISLNLKTKSIKLRVSHRNRDTRENNQLSCQLTIEGLHNIEITNVAIPDLGAYAIETIEATITSESLNINTLQKSLPYVLDCYLTSDNFKNEQVIKKAIIYQIPGQTASYR